MNETVSVTARGRVLLFHKPKGAIVSRAGERGQKTVYDLLPPWVRDEEWVPVGRLDQDTRGLLLFVREGALVESLTRPGACEKVYEVSIRGRFTPEHQAAVLQGVESPVGVLRAKTVEALGMTGPKTHLRVTLDEGKNRHIRRMFAALRDPKRGTPLKVMDLKRLSIGPLELDVPSGQWRFLKDEETERLLAALR